MIAPVAQDDLAKRLQRMLGYAHGVSAQGIFETQRKDYPIRTTANADASDKSGFSEPERQRGPVFAASLALGLGLSPGASPFAFLLTFLGLGLLFLFQQLDAYVEQDRLRLLHVNVLYYAETEAGAIIRITNVQF